MQTEDVDRKLLELAREALPAARRVGFLAGPGPPEAALPRSGRARPG